MVYNEDHHPNHLVVYCPRHYCRAVVDTWCSGIHAAGRHRRVLAVPDSVKAATHCYCQVFLGRLTPGASPQRHGFPETEKAAHFGKPRARRTTSFKVINIFDLECIIQASFETGIFTAAGGCWVQHQGTCIGNQISPVLSNLPVLLSEHEWRARANSSLCADELLFLRYVDNRLILTPKSVLQVPVVQEFCHANFYKDSIQLESVDDHKWLGFVIDAKCRTAQFCMPTKPWQLRSTHSAGSWRLCASGYFSRAALMKKYAWPPSDRPRQLQQLRQLYLAAGFPASELHRHL